MPLAASPANTFGILANADFQYPNVTLGDGKTARLDHAGFTDLRTQPNRTEPATVSRR